VDDPRPDSPRYEACGNAVTVPVAQWIGERIVSFEAASESNRRTAA
jgi:site-specific DNA-cytosine methylase